jgi:hypothetical protein
MKSLTSTVMSALGVLLLPAVLHAAPPTTGGAAVAVAPHSMQLNPTTGKVTPITAPGKFQPRSIEVDPASGKAKPITVRGTFQPRGEETAPKKTVDGV